MRFGVLQCVAVAYCFPYQVFVFGHVDTDVCGRECVCVCLRECKGRRTGDEKRAKERERDRYVYIDKYMHE